MLSANELRGGVFPAVPVPFDVTGRVLESAQRDYVAWMVEQPIRGVAVWAHTGRGLRLDVPDRQRVLTAWREGLRPGQWLIAAAGAAGGATEVGEVLAAARDMARHAARLGADALLVHPPVAFRGRSDLQQRILDYHSAVAEAGIPLILFYLYEEAGGLSYDFQTLAKLLNRPEVLGIKVATLDSVMTFQDLARLIQEEAPGKVLLSGEDRFLGYSLMCGAEAALIGMGAACVHPQVELVRAFLDGLAARFLALSRAVDELARLTFRVPMEGYIQRMLWCLVHEGVIPPAATFDPWGPPLEPGEFDRLGEGLKRYWSFVAEAGR